MGSIKFKAAYFLAVFMLLGSLSPSRPMARSVDDGHFPYQLFARRGGGHLQDKYRTWESLPPEKKRLLRKRLEEWKRLSPEDRALIRRRFEQWKRLPPEERRWLREKLMNWHKLSPEEREFIRKRFLRD